MRPDLPPWTFAVPASAWASTGAAYAQGWLLAGTGLLVVATLATAAYAALQFLQVAAAWEAWRSGRP